MLSCQENLIGIRGACDNIAPISGEYLEDLAGLTLQKTANAAEDRTGVQLMQTALDWGFKQVDKWILFYPDGQVTANSTLAQYDTFYRNPGFSSVLIPGAVDSKFSGVIRRTQDFSFTSLRIDTLFVKTREAKNGVVFSIDDGVSVQVLPAVDLLADEVTPIPADIEIASLNFTISGDLSGVMVYQGNKYPTACGACRTQEKHPYLNVTAAEGIECRILTQCSSEKLLCFIYNRPEYMINIVQAVMYQAGIYLYEDARVSTRANQSTQSLDLDVMSAQIDDWQEKSKKLIGVLMPNVLQYVKLKDKFCQKCGGWTSDQYLT